jgi:hypothetical protein
MPQGMIFDHSASACLAMVQVGIKSTFYMDAPSLHDFHHVLSGMIVNMITTKRDLQPDLGGEPWLKLGIPHIHKVLTCQRQGKGRHRNIFAGFS